MVSNLIQEEITLEEAAEEEMVVEMLGAVDLRSLIETEVCKS